MSSIIYPLILLFIAGFLLEPTDSALPDYLQNLELDDVTSLWDKFPSLVAQIKQAVNRFRCPKGWRRLGGSCYYLSEVLSLPSEANETCNEIHSNHSNLMQIRNTLELFYAARVLTKNNLTGLMIEIDPNLLKGKTMTELLMENQGRWQRIKEKFHDVRKRYYKIKEKIIKELHDAGLRISRRSKKIKQSTRKHKQQFIPDHIEPNDNDYDYYYENNNTFADVNETMVIDEYEYDSLDSDDDEKENFEAVEDLGVICDQINWNALNNNATVYLLTTYAMENRIVCSLSDIEMNTEYEHVCEYVLDFCFANIICGKHGHCVNTLSGFKCSCSFLYGGILCERRISPPAVKMIFSRLVSKQGKQIIIAIMLLAVLYGLSFKPVRWVLIGLVRMCTNSWRNRRRVARHKKQLKQEESIDDKEELVTKRRKAEDTDDELQPIPIQRRHTIAQEIFAIISSSNHQPLSNPNKRDLVRLCWVSGLFIFYLILLLSVTTITHLTSFKYDATNETKFSTLINETTRLVTRCKSISDYRKGNLIFFPASLALIMIFSWSIKREKRCPKIFDGRPGLIAPIEPFRTANRFTTATVFGILAFEVLKIFEEFLFNTVDPSNLGVLIELLIRIAMVIIIGLRYYPILASLQLRNVSVRFFACLYIIADIVYTIIREGSCMGFLPLSRYYPPVEEAELRREIGTWFVIYGLVKNTPHFILLSYIAAELCVRFAYDSVYVPTKKKRSIWSAPMAQQDESAFAKYYVKKLFRRSVRSQRVKFSMKVDENQMDDFEHEEELQRKANQSRLSKFIDSIYHWDDDFRFTSMTTCTYTVAVVFLYYLACTLVFLYISRTKGHISFIRYYIESTFSIEFRGFFSLSSTVIISGLLTVGIFLGQLFLGVKNYKKHKLQLFKGIYEDVPSAANFNPGSIASKSVHYSGFLVGYMAWGFVIVFHLIFFILATIHIISMQIRYFELILAFTVPVLVVYLLKMVGTSSAGKFLFIQDMDEKLNLKNRKVYAIFIYFNFFADCFLGIASCIIRLIKAAVLNLVFMARLDCSFLGRPIERLDLGFAAYVSYLHMEVTHTNPIMLAFCYSLYDDVIRRRKKACYDDECCIAAGELDDDDDDDETSGEVTPRAIERGSSKSSNASPNGSASKRSKVSPLETTVPATKKQKSVDMNDHDGGPPIEEVKPKTKSRSPSVASEKSSQKSKQKKLSIDHSLEEEGEATKNQDRSSRLPPDSTIARIIPHDQPRLPQPSAPFPDAPPRQDRPPVAKFDDEDDDEDDDGGRPPPSISTISKAIPKEAPRLSPMRQSSPPPVPPRQDSVDRNDDQEDDGGMGSHKSAKQKQKSETTKTKKEERKHRARDDDDDDEDDDGGLPPPSTSSITKIMPQHALRLSPPLPQASAPRPPPPPTISQRAPGAIPMQGPPPPPSTISQRAPGAIPMQRPPITFQQAPNLVPLQRLPPPVASQPAPLFMSMQRSGPPPPPLRQDLASAAAADDDDGDDGGINPKTIARRKQEAEKKKKEKEDRQKKKQLDDDDDDGGISQAIIAEKKKSKEKPKSKVPLILDGEDDDGGVSKEKRLAAEKKKQELEAKRKKQEEIKAKIKKDEDEDDDGGVSKEKRLAAEKKKQELEAKKKKKEESKAKIKPDDDEDDDGAVKRKESPQKKKPEKKASKSEILREEDEDDDGGRVVKTYDTIKKMMPTKQPVLDHQKKKSPSPEVLDDGSMLTSRPAPEPLQKSYDTVGRIVPKISKDDQKPREENHYDTIPTDEERTSRARPTHSSPPREVPLLRTISYREATENTSPEDKSSPTRSNINDDASHHSTPSGIVNRSYSNHGSIHSASNHSVKHASKQSSPQTLKDEQHTEESTVESEEEEDEEEEEEEEEEEKPKEKPLKLQLKPIPDISTAFSTLTHMFSPEEAEKIRKIIKQKQARFRWFLAYTIINNYHLFDLRKHAQSRLARLRIERSNLIDEQQQAAIAAALVVQQPVLVDVIPSSPGIRLKTTMVATPVPASPGLRPPGLRTLLSVPVPVVDNFPQSPAERYVAIRSSMIYDVNAQQADTPRSPISSQVPSTVSQPTRLLAKSSGTPRSLGFQTTPVVVVQPPSDTTSKSKGKRPHYERQETEQSDPLIINQLSATPVFQAMPESNQSTADYPIAGGSSITNSSTLRTQMSHAQHMRAWRHGELRKIQKKRTNCYHYGTPLRRPVEEKVASAAILTPQIILEQDDAQRLASTSPFSFPHHEKVINETTRNRPTPSSSITDESKQSVRKKNLRTTAPIQRKDSQNSGSNATAV